MSCQLLVLTDKEKNSVSPTIQSKCDTDLVFETQSLDESFAAFEELCESLGKGWKGVRRRRHPGIGAAIP